jgi:hypothetical protein
MQRQVPVGIVLDVDEVDEAYLKLLPDMVALGFIPPDVALLIKAYVPKLPVDAPAFLARTHVVSAVVVSSAAAFTFGAPGAPSAIAIGLSLSKMASTDRAGLSGSMFASGIAV